MRNLLLSVSLSAVALGASASVPGYTQNWSKSVSSTFENNAASFRGNVAVDKAGNLIASGLFNKALTLGSQTLEPIGTSAYLAKYDNSGNLNWSVGMIGACTITSIATDATGNIYVAGVFADEVEFGTTSGETITKAGVKIGDDYATSQEASFVAFYSADGALKAVQAFVPTELDAVAGMIDGYPFFQISKIVADDNGTVYGSATYTGKTTVGETSFTSTFDDMFGLGFLYANLKSAGVFSITADGKCKSVVSVGTGENLISDGETTLQYQAYSASVAKNGANIVAAFSGSGPLAVKADKDTVVSASSSEANYIFTQLNAEDGKLTNFATIAAPSNFNSNYQVQNVLVSGSSLAVVGSETSEINDVVKNQMYVFSGADIENLSKTVNVVSAENIGYYTVLGSALTKSNEVILNAGGYYLETMGEGDNKVSKGNFAKSSKTFAFAKGQFSEVSSMQNAVGVATEGNFMAISNALVADEAGLNFSLLSAGSGSAAVEGIDNANATAEYFNLQGVRVNNPENGVYILRQGSKVSKVIVRK